MIKAILVDDEQDSRETLRNYVNKYCPEVSLLCECKNIEEAKAGILKHKPDLVFLDIEMPRGNAFDLLEQWDEIDFEIIFVTAYSEYALQAFNMSATSYLLKPLEIEALEEAVELVNVRLRQKDKVNRAKILLENMANINKQSRKLVLPLMEGFDVVKMNQVMYCEAMDNFTCFYFIDGTKSVICRSLKFYENILNDFGFCRIHRSSLINLEFVTRYKKGKGGSVILENGTELLVSNSKKIELIERIKANC